MGPPRQPPSRRCSVAAVPFGALRLGFQGSCPHPTLISLPLVCLSQLLSLSFLAQVNEEKMRKERTQGNFLSRILLFLSFFLLALLYVSCCFFSLPLPAPHFLSFFKKYPYPRICFY